MLSGTAGFNYKNNADHSDMNLLEVTDGAHHHILDNNDFNVSPAFFIAENGPH
jgi:hypothetical protein